MPESPAINPDEIQVELDREDPPDRFYTITMPAHCVVQITERLDAAGEPHEGERLRKLLTTICIEEAVGRLEIESLWGPAPMAPEGEPGDPTKGDFIVRVAIDERPEVAWPAWNSFNFERPCMDISDAMVEAELTEQRLNAGERSETPGPLAVGEEAACEVCVTPDGSAGAEQPFTSTIRIPPSGQPAMVEGRPLPGLAEQLIGAGVGDTVEAVCPGAGPGGGPLRVTAQIQQAWRVTPSTIEEVVTALGMPNEAILRMNIRTSMEARFKDAQRAHLVDQVFTALAEQVDIPISNRILAVRLRERAGQMAQKLQAAGHSREETIEIMKDAGPEQEAITRSHLKRNAIVNLIRPVFELGIAEQDVAAEIQKLAAAQGRRPEDLRKEIVDANQIDMVANRVFEQKIADRILAEATVVDVPVAS
ncbi:MAG: hypothetical protein QF733_09210 [Phycisphaerales bacterium]|jgi:FKBP-type peptidyl-prolyl cis-trans isomerase (trigger factor)|nr:hypothetical protein [Phycisphaerales bacterium]